MQVKIKIKVFGMIGNMRNYKIIYLESRCVFKLPLISYGDTWHASKNSNNGGTIFAVPKDAIMDGLE